jgi:hypothetical protein
MFRPAEASYKKQACVDDPLHLAHAGAEIRSNAFHGETDDGCIDLRDQYAERSRYKY